MQNTNVKVIVGVLAGIGGVWVTKAVVSFILEAYHDEIKETVIKKTVSYFFDDNDNTQEQDPVKAALLAYLDAKKGA